MAAVKALLLIFFSSLFIVSLAGFNEAYVCSACTMVLGLVEQAGLQIRLENYLKSQCTNKLCEESVNQLILAAVAQLNPDAICSPDGLDVCPGNRSSTRHFPFVITSFGYDFFFNRSWNKVVQQMARKPIACSTVSLTF